MRDSSYVGLVDDLRAVSWGLAIVCSACLLACGGRTQSLLGTPTADAGGAFARGAAGATAADAGGAPHLPEAGASGAFEGGATEAPDVGSSGEGGSGGIFGAPNPAHPCDGANDSVTIGTLDGPKVKISHTMNTNLPFAQFESAGSDGARAELAGVGTVLRFRDSFVDYDHGGYVYLELQISGIPALGDKIAIDPIATDNLHFQVGLSKAWDPVPGQTITVRGISRTDGGCWTYLAFELKRLKMQPSAVDANQAQGTFEFDGVFQGNIADYH